MRTLLFSIFSALASANPWPLPRDTIQFPAQRANPIRDFLANPLEPLNRIGSQPWSILKALLGTSLDPAGGADIQIDSRVAAHFARPPFLVNGKLPPPQNPECYNFWKRRAVWAARAARKLTNTTRDEPMIALITDLEELATFSAQELECLFYLGYDPLEVPLGIAYTRPYYVLGSIHLNDAMAALVGGKLVFEAPCDRAGNPIYMVVTDFNRAPEPYAQMYRASAPVNSQFRIFPEDVIDTDQSLWIDYNAHFEQVCPALLPRYADVTNGPLQAQRILDTFGPKGLSSASFSELRDVTQGNEFVHGPRVGRIPEAKIPAAQFTLGVFDQSWPVRYVIEQLRWVGRDLNENVDLYLTRALYAFPEGYRTVAWWNYKVPKLSSTPVVVVDSGAAAVPAAAPVETSGGGEWEQANAGSQEWQQGPSEWTQANEWNSNVQQAQNY